MARRRLALDLHRFDAVITLQLRRTVSPFHRAEGGKRHHGSAAAAHIQLLHILRVHAVRGVGLHVHFLDSVVGIEKIVDVARAPGNREGLVDVGGADAKSRSFFAVDIDFEGWIVGLAGKTDLRQRRILFRHGQQLVAGFGQCVMAEPTAIL